MNTTQRTLFLDYVKENYQKADAFGQKLVKTINNATTYYARQCLIGEDKDGLCLYYPVFVKTEEGEIIIDVVDYTYGIRHLHDVWFWKIDEDGKYKAVSCYGTKGMTQTEVLAGICYHLAKCF